MHYLEKSWLNIPIVCCGALSCFSAVDRNEFNASCQWGRASTGGCCFTITVWTMLFEFKPSAWDTGASLISLLSSGLLYIIMLVQSCWMHILCATNASLLQCSSVIISNHQVSVLTFIWTRVVSDVVTDDDVSDLIATVVVVISSLE